MRFLLDALFPPRDDELTVRAISHDSFLELLEPKIAYVTRPATMTLMPFAHERVRPVLHEAKYHGSSKALTLLGAALAQYLEGAELDPERTRIVPVPLGSGRLRERGYNQTEEVVARAAKRCGIKIERDLLTRERETLSQVALARHEREINMFGAFAAPRPADPALTYIVFDDTVTTGATLQAAIDALESAGAKHILPLALAH